MSAAPLDAPRIMNIHALRDIVEGHQPEGHFTWPNEEQVVFISRDDATVVVEFDDHCERPQHYEQMISRSLQTFIRCINLGYDAQFRREALWLTAA